MEIRINIRAELIHVDNATGIITLAVEGRSLTVEESKVLDKLFPHCSSEIQVLMEKEAIIHSITDEGSKENSIYRKN